MYSEYSPYPGRFIKLLSDINIVRKRFYSFLAKRYRFNEKSAYDWVKGRFLGFTPSSDAQITIIDVGCGTGEHTLDFAIAFPNAKVIGIDNSSGSLKYAEELRNYFGINNVQFIKKDLEGESLNDLGKFDLLNCSGVLHHVENPNNALKNITKLMKTNSILWIYLYADFGRHREYAARKGIRLIFPDDNLLRERANLAKELDLNRSVLSMGESKYLKYRWKFLRTKKNLSYWGYHNYTDRNGDNDIYDGFAHPIVDYYDTKKIWMLMSEGGLDLLQYNMQVNANIEKVIRPHLEQKKIYDSMEIAESLYYPQSYYLLLSLAKICDN